jgi:hypothetical protein
MEQLIIQEINEGFLEATIFLILVICRFFLRFFGYLSFSLFYSADVNKVEPFQDLRNPPLRSKCLDQTK